MLQTIGVEPLNISSEGTEFSVVRDLTVANMGLCCSLEASVSADVANKNVVVLDVDAPPLLADVLELTPGRGSSGLHESGFAPFDPKIVSADSQIIPTITVVDDTFDRYRDVMVDLILQARRRAKIS